MRHAELVSKGTDSTEPRRLNLNTLEPRRLSLNTLEPRRLNLGFTGTKEIESRIYWNEGDCI